MSRADTWMPLYIGDYLADTMSLEAREHGAYLLLIMHYWRNGPLPDDDRALAGIARVDRALWISDTGPIVREFFQAKDGRLHHKRIDRERESAQTIAETKRAAAQARWGKSKRSRMNGSDPSGSAHASAPASPEAAAPPDDAPASAYEDARGDAYASDMHIMCISPSPSQKEERKGSKGERVRAPGRAGARPPPAAIPDDWQPSISLIAFGLSLGLSEPDIERSADRMRDWSISEARRKADWDAAFRHWLRGDAERARYRRPTRDVDPIGQLRRDWGLSTFLEPLIDDEQPYPSLLQ